MQLAVPRFVALARQASLCGANAAPVSRQPRLSRTARGGHKRIDAIHRGYGFARHKDYGTPEHLAALERLGPCRAHRLGFAPVRGLVVPALT